jgi:hypothetical protein
MERWRKIDRIYNSAVELEPARREAFIMQACAGNESLLADVKSLLERTDHPTDFMEAAAMERVAQDLDADSSSKSTVSQVARKRAQWWMYVLATVILSPAAVTY